MTKRSFHVIAHRGDCTHAPENTFPAFELAVEKRAHGIETDVRVTRDGVAVLHHDAGLARSAGVDVLVEALSFAELSALDVGRLRGEQFAGTHVPRLDGFLAKYLPRIPLQIELKAAAAVAPLIGLLRQHDAIEQVLVTSFEAEFLQAAHAAEPRLKLGWLLRTPLAPGEIKQLGCAVAIPHSADATRDYVRELYEAGLRVRSWGVKDLTAAAAVVHAGVEAATYNDPAELLAWLAAHPA